MKISAIIPTCESRWDRGTTFRSLPNLTRKPDEILVIMDGDEEKVEEHTLAGVPVRVIHTRQRGAAAKRNLGVEQSIGQAILFTDDDMELEKESLEALEQCLKKDQNIGGAGSFIVNQTFNQPGLYSQVVYWLAGGWGIKEFSGRCFGPLINIYPRPWLAAEAFRECEWLNTAFTLYRRDALPEPAFEKNFTGYSFMEDVALSRRVRKKWKIGMARNARVVHHTHPAPYKKNLARLQQMALENKYHILLQVERWSGTKAALAITWLELLLLPAKLREVVKNPKNIGVLSGCVSGLAKIWGRSL